MNCLWYTFLIINEDTRFLPLLDSNGLSTYMVYDRIGHNGAV